MTQQPRSRIAPAGEPATLTVTASGAAPLQYQWRKDGANLTDDGHYQGVTTPTLTIYPVAPVDAGIYDVVITNSCGTVTSLGAVLTVREPGDLNCDGAVNFGDINPFVLLLACRSCYTQQYPQCEWILGDLNHDGQITFADINPFVARLSSPPD